MSAPSRPRSEYRVRGAVHKGIPLSACNDVTARTRAVLPARLGGLGGRHQQPCGVVSAALVGVGVSSTAAAAAATVFACVYLSF